MAQIDHPDRDDRIDVEIINEQSHYNKEMVQVQATEDGIELSDQSGEKPWLWAEEVDEA